MSGAADGSKEEILQSMNILSTSVLGAGSPMSAWWGREQGTVMEAEKEVNRIGWARAGQTGSRGQTRSQGCGWPSQHPPWAWAQENHGEQHLLCPQVGLVRVEGPGGESPMA